MNGEAIESQVDVGGLEKEDIPAEAFPAEYPSADFRVWIDERAYADILNHASVDTGMELCGVMIGQLRRDEFGPFILIRAAIRGNKAAQGTAEVTLTHQTWAEIFSTLDNEYPQQRIMGWYHTHPGFGIFLSPQDLFVHRHFFDLPHQVAMVVDPVRGEEGLFIWKHGEPVRAGQYWVGETLKAPNNSWGTEAEHCEAQVTADEEGAEQKIASWTFARAALIWNLVYVVLIITLVLFLWKDVGRARNRVYEILGWDPADTPEAVNGE